jgi:outer membrane protein
MKNRVSLACASMVVILLIATEAGAAAESPWRLGIALGYGERSNPLILAEDIPLAVDLDIAWFGKYFYFDNGDIGLTFADTPAVTASLTARFNSDRVFFAKTNTRFVSVGLAGEPLAADIQVKVPERDFAVEAGFELLSDGRWGHLQFSAHHDVSGTHDGYELDVNYGVGWRLERWYFEPSVGASFKSADMNNYYWGVRQEESSPALPAYEAESGINYRARIIASYHLDRHWAISLAAEYERINDEAAASPIVDESGVLGFFVGARYRF